MNVHFEDGALSDHIARRALRRRPVGAARAAVRKSGGMPKPVRLGAIALFAALLSAGSAWADDYPSRPIRMVAPAPPGGASDMYARLIGSKISATLGRPVIVDNRAGAGGRIGYENAAKSPADGYTLILGGTGVTLQRAMYQSLPYDPVKDFAPISLIARTQLVMVTPMSLPVSDLRSFIALVKANPKVHNYASSGVGNPPHLAAELLCALAGVQMTHIPLTGDAPAITELLAGRVSAYFGLTAPAIPQIKSGKLRAIAVTGTTRSSALPDVPTMAEAGLPGYNYNGWFGIMAPAGTPAPIVARLTEAVVKAMAMPDTRSRISDNGDEPISSSAEEFSRTIANSLESFREIMRIAGIKPQP